MAISASLYKIEDPDIIERVMNVNFSGTFVHSSLGWMNLKANLGAVRTAFYCLPALRKSHGHIVVTSSVYSRLVSKGTHVYAASKAALNSFFDSVRLEEVTFSAVARKCLFSFVGPQ